MNLRKRNKSNQTAAPALQVQTAGTRRSLEPWERLHFAGPCGAGERQLYRSLRQSIPVIHAALCKLVRLLGEFQVTCGNREAEASLRYFLEHVQVNGCQTGIWEFVGVYFDQLLTYGTAVGEMVLSAGGEEIAALYNADLDDVEFCPGRSPMEWTLCRKETSGELRPIPYPELIVTAALNPPSGRAQGVSVLKSLPFVSDILLKIYHTIGVNWERVGNVRFAVTYKPTGDSVDRMNAKDHARQMAEEWSRAMQPGGQISDFVAVGDVNVKVIGADNQILDSEIPVRQMLEQIVSALGVPPFLLGFSWSSTERMSSQQADILTSEMDSYRRLLTPAICKICDTWLMLHGYEPRSSVQWEDITLQDAVDLAEARLKNAQAAQIEASLPKNPAGSIV